VALIVLVTLPLIPVFGVLIGSYAAPGRSGNGALSSCSPGNFVDVVAGLPTLKVFGRRRPKPGRSRT